MQLFISDTFTDRYSLRMWVAEAIPVYMGNY